MNLFWVVTSVADAAEINPNGIKTLLVSDWSIFFINIEEVSINGPRSLPINLRDYGVWLLDSFILADSSRYFLSNSFDIWPAFSIIFCKNLLF